HETMHCHSRSAVLERMVLDERNFGKRRDRLQALRFVLNPPLDQGHWNAFRCALGQMRHERFGHRALRHGFSDGEVESCGHAPWIAHSARCCADEARSLHCVICEAHLRALAVGCRVVESERQVTQSIRKRVCARSIAASRTALKEGCGLLKW